MATKKIDYDYKTLTLQQMMDYILANDVDGKADFKAQAMASGTYNHFNARKYFCEKYMPEIIPVKAEKKPTAKDLLKDW